MEGDTVNFVSSLQIKKIENEDKNSRNNYFSDNETSDKRLLHFLICDSCFWCASYIRRDASIIKCPSCNCIIESIPISRDQNSKLGEDSTRVTTEFFCNSLDSVAYLE
jgi:hypothetical protein